MRYPAVLVFVAGCSFFARPGEGQPARGNQARIDLKPPSVAVGVLDGDPSQQFGDLTAVASQRGARFAVLDARLGVLRIFDTDGKSVGQSGRSGSGPGEFRVPTALVPVGGDTVAVLDQSLSRVSFFNTAVATDGFVRSFQLDVPSRDFCGLGKWLFVAGFRARDSSTIRRIDLAGTELGAFGQPFPNSQDMGLARMVSLQTRIACLPAQRLVVLASDWYPIVRAHDATTGELRWTMSLSHFEQTVIEPSGGGGVRFRPPKSQTIHKIVAILPLDSALVLVQLERTAKPSADAPVIKSFELRLVRADTGTEVGSQTGFLRALASDGSTLFLADTTDYPRLLRAEYVLKK